MPVPRSVALLGALAIAAAPGATRPDPGPRPLRHDLRLDLALTAGAWAAWVAADVAKERLAPARCRVCGTNGLDAEARQLMVWGAPGRAGRASDVVLALVPAGVMAHQVLAAHAAGDVRGGLVDILLVLEAAGLAMDLEEIANFAAGRQRPSVHYVGSRDPARSPEAQDNLSFYSGHATLAFSLVAAAGTVSSLRGYRSAPWVWALGMSLAALTAYLRVAADEHYLTDVLVGAATGTALGVAIPRLLHAPEAGTGAGTLVAFPMGLRVVF